MQVRIVYTLSVKTYKHDFILDVKYILYYNTKNITVLRMNSICCFFFFLFFINIHCCFQIQTVHIGTRYIIKVEEKYWVIVLPAILHIYLQIIHYTYK